MSFKSAIFASARVKSKESKMIGIERLNRMIEAATADEILKILNETSYGEGVTVTDSSKYQTILDAEQNNLVSFFKEACPEDSILECFLLFYDYSNAKALVKAKYLKTENYNFMTYENGIMDTKQLADYIFNDNYTFLPPFMAKALSGIDTAYASYGANPAVWDSEINKAMYKDISEKSEKCENKVKEYFRLKADIENLLTVIKCKLMDFTLKEFEQQYVSGGDLNLKAFEQTLGVNNDTAAEMFRHTDISDIAQQGFKNLDEKGITLIETETDNTLNKFFADKVNELNTVYPLINYYLSKLAEIKNIKLIFTGVSGGASKAEIRKRIRTV